MITATIPLRIVSAANRREHWAAKARRAKAERAAAMAVPKPRPAARYRITLTRIGPRAIKDEHDNLPTAFKALVDGIADRLGIDDGDERLTWVYRQERGTEYAVRVEIEGENT